MKKYIIISLKHSTKKETAFWRANDSGYTTNPWNAGVYDEQDVKNSPGYYNDGFNSVAICITNSSEQYSGLNITLDVEHVKQYREENLGEL